MKIRKAQPEDLGAWLDLRSQLLPDPKVDHLAELEEYFSDTSIDIVQAYVVEDDSQAVVGFIELNLRNFAEGSRSPRVPYVEAWFVRSGCRGQGWGRRLMRQAEQWALAQGFSELASDTELVNKKSIAVHRALGFEETERVVCFLKKLA
ncbi:MAG: GNAT family N-acetyltransferase [Pseudomonadota bacterium]